MKSTKLVSLALAAGLLGVVPSCATSEEAVPEEPLAESAASEATEGEVAMVTYRCSSCGKTESLLANAPAPSC